MTDRGSGRRPKVSVCVPLFNHARFLPEAIESVLGQTLRSFEVVLGDDGPTDGGLQIARAYAARYPERVRVFTPPGRNASLHPRPDFPLPTRHGNCLSPLGT